ncbi:hypothetical protein OUZ56_032325 [Daphnia magna]|uniref:Zinc finger/thioredoxin putative domain-containing protein n=1 Tax=Daphnia magna TaxID=35525 RepID=A0ABR0B8K7_9CRUS|nr:hypothetical protein OUZ56_032325 [Daphnia magna]
MDVTCERCHAEYEFDDALVGARGTMVRCTECDATFRVAAPGRGSDHFRVDYDNLRELREAVRDGVVDGNFLLVDGDGGGRPLSSVDELRDWLRDSPIPLIGAHTGSARNGPPTAPSSTDRESAWEMVRAGEVVLLPASAKPGDLEAAIHGRRPDRRGPISVVPPPMTTAEEAPRPSVLPPKVRSASQSMSEIAAVSVASLPPMSSEPATTPDGGPITTGARPFATAIDGGPITTGARASIRPSLSPISEPIHVGRLVPPPPRTPSLENAPRTQRMSDAPATASEPRTERMTDPPPTMESPSKRPSPRSPLPTPSSPPAVGSDVSALLFRPEAPPRRGGFLVAGALAVVALGVVGFRYARANGGGTVPSASALPSAAPSAPVAATSYTLALDEGRIDDAEKALADAPPSRAREIGDLRVAVARAEFATWRALLTNSAGKAAGKPTAPAATQAEADRSALVAEAARRSDAIPSGTVAEPDPPALTLARIDQMRLSGNVGRGRALMTPTLRNDPAATYSLAALDFGAGGKVDWSKLLEPLRKAAATERHAGRARVALAYALSMTGDSAGAVLEANRVRASCDDRPRRRPERLRRPRRGSAAVGRYRHRHRRRHGDRRAGRQPERPRRLDAHQAGGSGPSRRSQGRCARPLPAGPRGEPRLSPCTHRAFRTRSRRAPARYERDRPEARGSVPSAAKPHRAAQVRAAASVTRSPMKNTRLGIEHRAVSRPFRTGVALALAATVATAVSGFGCAGRPKGAPRRPPAARGRGLHRPRRPPRRRARGRRKEHARHGAEDAEPLRSLPLPDAEAQGRRRRQRGLRRVWRHRRLRESARSQRRSRRLEGEGDPGPLLFERLGQRELPRRRPGLLKDCRRAGPARSPRSGSPVGKFKGAEEPLTRDGPTPEARQSLEGYLSDTRTLWLDAVSAGRPKVAKDAFEDGPYAPNRAKELGLVDAVGYADDTLDALKAETSAPRAVPVFGPKEKPSDEEVGDLFKVLAGGEGKRSPVVVLRATGSIAMAGQGNGVLGGDGGITDKGLGAAIAKLDGDDAVKAVVLRIDSRAAARLPPTCSGTS